MSENIIVWCSRWLKFDPVEDVWVNGMFHNICGPVTIGIFRGKFAENAKDQTSVEYEPVYSHKDDRFFQEYRFDVSKLEPSIAKGEMDGVLTYVVQVTHTGLASRVKKDAIIDFEFEFEFESDGITFVL